MDYLGRAIICSFLNAFLELLENHALVQLSRNPERYLPPGSIHPLHSQQRNPDRFPSTGRSLCSHLDLLLR